jgi:proline iminopeptidase
MCALEAEEGFATAPDGPRIFYRVSGRGPFATVMPANWGVDSYVYAKGLSSLEFWLALVTFDPRGVGRSGPARSADEFAMGVTARDASAVEDALHVDRSVVIGHSSGGSVALTYALAYPERVSHLILISTGAVWAERGEESPDAPYPSTEEAMRQQYAASISLALHDPSKFSRAMQELLPRMRFSPERFRWTEEVEFDAYDLRPRLVEIRVPVLILHGREDQVVSVRRAHELHAGIAGSRLVVLENCGHWPFVERRHDFVAAVRDFLGLESEGDRRKA